MSTVDIQEVVKFLRSTTPFAQLEYEDVQHLVSTLDVIYIPKEGCVKFGNNEQQASIFDGLYIIRRGAFEVSDSGGALVDKIADGECFGILSVLPSDAEPASEAFEATALEDSLLFRLPKKDFQVLAHKSRIFADFFADTGAKRLDKLFLNRQNVTVTDTSDIEAKKNTRNPSLTDKPMAYDSMADQSVSSQSWDVKDSGQQLSLPVTHIMSSNLIMVSPDCSIQDAAATMTRTRVSSILVVENNNLVGIVTDRDLRSRVLAAGLSPSKPVKAVMTKQPIVLHSSALSMTAQLLMSENNIHHLPIVDKSINKDVDNSTHNMTPIGIVTVTDVLRHQQLSPLLMVSEINRQPSIEGLVNVCSRLPKLIKNLTQVNINPVDMGEILASITDNLTRRLIALAIDTFGSPPMRFNFLVFGSQARKDQSLGSDQDNGLMLEREPLHNEVKYFNDLARFICDALDKCGIPLCPGNIMATNPQCCLTQTQWQQKFIQWMDSASPKSLLKASIFFDVRNIHGPSHSVDSLTELIQVYAKKNSIFLATLTRNSTQLRPPLGFFRDFVLEHTGEHKNTLDLKHQALSLINDLARIYSFSTSSYQSNTCKRLQQVGDEKLLSQDYVKSLQDAWLYLSELRLYAQQYNWQKNNSRGAFLDPSCLSPLNRKYLKAAFKTILDVQNAAQHRFAKGVGG
ncbi:DUF294 nucleotidyltransferase-like domain-containing protein [Agarilytica rhodophyticola]|uniref:DUF294 nucleotidyltransferase-like domain-containing protein n=1 Tax=Agarilytica rhodophyticola TaxID=1737490 RepID=UPI000B341F40|nr:DUF294 nucleotidyltransferase-like domain-containing protein [Agarilytica rhodophyticola]